MLKKGTGGNVASVETAYKGEEDASQKKAVINEMNKIKYK